MLDAELGPIPRSGVAFIRKSDREAFIPGERGLLVIGDNTKFLKEAGIVNSSASSEKLIWDRNKSK